MIRRLSLLCSVIPMFSMAVAGPLDDAVVIEAEDPTSDMGEWVLKTDIEGFSGKGHLEFTGNKYEFGPPNSPLTYEFKVPKDGEYRLILRCHKRLISERADICNDAYVRVDGEYESANDTPLEILQSDTKFFGGAPVGWGGAFTLDKNHKKMAPIYKFKAGETYTFVMTGRSKNFNVDQIMFIPSGEGYKEVRESLTYKKKEK